jgi:N-acetylmuramoyl-L-alanine amidase
LTALYKIDSGLVYQKLDANAKWEQVDFYPTPNQSGTINPKYLVIHYTAGRLDAHGTAQYFQRPEAKTSAHLNLSEDGTLTQNVSLEKKAWHAGKSSWGGDQNLNNHSIGIEVCNPGPLEITSLGYKSWFGKYYDDVRIIESPHPNRPDGQVFGWLPFTESQIQVLLNLGKVIVKEYRLLETVGHDMISPYRKSDPGPCMSSLVYNKLNEEDRCGDGGGWDWFVDMKISEHLNGRAGPGTEFSVLAKLKPGEDIDEIIERRGVWWQIETVSGLIVWVHNKFLRTRRFELRKKDN